MVSAGPAERKNEIPETAGDEGAEDGIRGIEETIYRDLFSNVVE